MIRTSKEIAVLALMNALLIGGQFVLSGIPGVEIVTVLFFSFCYAFGIRRGVIVACTYSLLRCIFFGFFPHVLILYLIYYNLLAAVAGAAGIVLRKKRAPTVVGIVVCTALAALCTACFTLLDDVVTPLYFGYTPNAWRVYFYASLPTMTAQIICASITVAVMMYPLVQVYSYVKL